MSLILTPLQKFPLIKPGDNLAEIIELSLTGNHITIQDGDILVIAQKIVSKCEGRLVNLTLVKPGKRAQKLAETVQKDARFVELVLKESTKVLRKRPGTVIVEHKSGFICANAGIDHSNVDGPWGEADDWVLLLPEDSDKSARQVREYFQKTNGKEIGVLIIDSHGRAWRTGTVGTAIGMSGVPGLVDLRGKEDLFGFQLKITQVGAADELAGAASLVMGQASEGIPVVHVSGFPYVLRDSSITELIRPRDLDLFR